MMVAGVGAVALGAFVWQASKNGAATINDDNDNDNDSSALGTQGDDAGIGEIDVSVDSSDSRLRWIKLLDSDGDEMARGRPNAQISLPLGVYTLQASVVGRQVAEAEFDLVTDVSWSCTPEDEGSVVCESDERILLLTPRD
jgi:hypothetical protein